MQSSFVDQFKHFIEKIWLKRMIYIYKSNIATFFSFYL